MIGGVTRHMSPHLHGVPHLHVNRSLGCVPHRIALAPTRKPCRIGLLFTHKWFVCDFCNGAKLHHDDLESGFSHTGYVSVTLCHSVFRCLAVAVHSLVERIPCWHYLEATLYTSTSKTNVKNAISSELCWQDSSWSPEVWSHFLGIEVT